MAYSKFRLFFLMAVIVIMAFPANVRCEDQKRVWNYAFYFENDAFTQTDHLYTNGLRFSVTSPSAPTWEELGFVPKWFLPVAKWLPFVNTSGLGRSMSFFIGQNMYLPEKDRTVAATVPNRPYAGMSYFSTAFNSNNHKYFNMLELGVGVVGPSSFAEETQRAVHDILGQDSPAGWVNQVGDAVFFDIQIEHRQRWTLFDSPTGVGMELIPSIGAGIGRALFHAQTGFRLRFGWNLPTDFGDDYIRPGATNITPISPNFGGRPTRRRISLFVFGGADGQMIFWDMTLHGELFQPVDTVDEENFRYVLVGGVGVLLGPLKVCYTHVHSSKTYKTQEKNQEYGTLLMTLSY
jgi:lipid A 3-O-deacylase